MPNFPRTDLAVEAEALRSAAAAAQLPGVRAEQTQRRGFAITQVEVLDAAGSEALCKPIGRYDTLDLTPLLRRADDAFENAAQTLSELLRAALPLMPERLGCTVQLTDTGITPGSGVGNDRAGLDRTTLGVPVAAIGLPTVIDAGSLTDDPRAEQMFVTPRDIDAVVRDAAKLIGYGIDLALHDGLTVADLDLLLS